MLIPSKYLVPSRSYPVSTWSHHTHTQYLVPLHSYPVCTWSNGQWLLHIEHVPKSGNYQIDTPSIVSVHFDEEYPVTDTITSGRCDWTGSSCFALSCFRLTSGARATGSHQPGTSQTHDLRCRVARQLWHHRQWTLSSSWWRMEPDMHEWRQWNVQWDHKRRNGDTSTTLWWWQPVSCSPWWWRRWRRCYENTRWYNDVLFNKW